MSDYRVFGLKVRSEIPLPELAEDGGAGEPDVCIGRGAVAPPVDASDGIHAADGSLVLVVPEVGRYRVADGKTITVDAPPEVPDRNVRLFLLGSAFGALLHQRGLLPLHANAVEIGGKAVAFMGESGAGKSTLAAWFHDRGYRVLADDVCVVRFRPNGAPEVSPGLPRLRLWRDTMESSSRPLHEFERSYSGDSPYDKFDVPVDGASTASSPVPLSMLYLLDRAEHFSISQVIGVDAADAIFANTYRGSFIAAAGSFKSHWRSAIQLVQSVPVFRAARRWNLAQMDAECRLLLDHADAVLTPSVEDS